MLATPKTSYFKKMYKPKPPFLQENMGEMIDEMPRQPKTPNIHRRISKSTMGMTGSNMSPNRKSENTTNYSSKRHEYYLRSPKMNDNGILPEIKGPHR